MKIRKILIIVLAFLSFMATGWLISNIQSIRADQILSADGLSTDSHEFKTKRRLTIRDLLKKLQDDKAGRKIEVQLTNQYNANEVLIWSNYDLQPLPVASGRFFRKGDFNGRVMFGVIGADTAAQILQTQNNKYIKEDNRYISVIGSLKDNGGSSRTKYYLTAGISQSSSQADLRDYKIIIDGLSRDRVTKVAQYLNTKTKVPDFVNTYRHTRGFHSKGDMFVLVILVLFSAFLSFLTAIYNRKLTQMTRARGPLFKKLLTNQGIHFLLLLACLALGAFMVLRFAIFFSQIETYGFLLLGILGFQGLVYAITSIYYH